MLRLVLLLLSLFGSSTSSQPQPDTGSGWNPDG